MAEEKKLTQEELEAKLKRLEELEAANAAKAKTEVSGDGGDKSNDKGKKQGVIDKVKAGASAFWNHGFTPKEIVTGVAVGVGLFLGWKVAYGKGKADAEAEAEFNSPALPDNGTEPLMLESAEKPEIIEASVEDYATEEVYEDE